MKNLVLYITCLFLGGAGAWIIGKTAPKFGLVDLPNQRSSHAMPTPKGGGVGILAAFFLSSLTLGIPKSFWTPATFLALFSFFGDKVELSPKFRLPVQFIAALILLSPNIFSNFSISFCPLLSVPCLFFLAVYIVGTANFYNFMDGINGIAGITGMVSFGLLAFYASHSGSCASIAALAVCISLACLGFLPFNMPTAKVFMGDVGSILLGFVFAGMVVYLSNNFMDFMCFAALLFPFYADELTTMVIRIKDGENLSEPHRRHLYQLLVNEYRIPHWHVSLGYGLFQLLVGLSVLFLKNKGLYAISLTLTLYFFSFLVFSHILRKKLD